jgi:hypothetical protein
LLHVTGLEPLKHVIATYLLFLAKYLHPRVIWNKLRVFSELPEPEQLPMSRIVPLDLALGAPRPPLNLFSTFTECDPLAVADADFKSELLTRVNSSVAAMTALLTHGLRLPFMDSSSYSKCHLPDTCHSPHLSVLAELHWQRAAA